MHFKLQGALYWIINNFLTYVNLPGWSTKHYFACPSCTKGTHVVWLGNGHRFCYMGHEQWLPKDHLFQYDVARFDGNVEHRCTPEPFNGSVVLAELEGTTFIYGMSETQHMETDEKNDQQIWKTKEYVFRFAILGVQRSLL